MKKLSAILIGVCLLALCVCGCDTKNNVASSEGSSGNNENQSKVTEVEYWQEYDGTPPANKKYVIFSTPQSSVKEGIVNDPNADVLAVKDIRNLYFGFEDDAHTKQKPLEFIKEDTTTADSNIPQYKDFEYNGKKYVIEYCDSQSKVVNETHIFAGKPYKFVKYYDCYRIWSENQEELLYKATVCRDTGKLVDLEIRDNEIKTQDNIKPISKEEAKQKIVQYVNDFCGEDVAEKFEIEKMKISEFSQEGKIQGYYSDQNFLSIEGYKVYCRLYVSISAVGDLKCIKLLGFNNMDVYNTACIIAFQEYGKEAFDKAKLVLESAVDLADACCYIAFDSTGKIYYYASKDISYPNDGCWGTHRMCYAVEILK